MPTTCRIVKSENVFHHPELTPITYDQHKVVCYSTMIIADLPIPRFGHIHPYHHRIPAIYTQLDICQGTLGTFFIVVGFLEQKKVLC